MDAFQTVKQVIVEFTSTVSLVLICGRILRREWNTLKQAWRRRG